MEFDNSFEVPLPVAEAWTLLMDIERIVPCVPGAELTEIVDADNYKGKVSPFIPGCQVIFSQVKGKQTLVSNHAFTTVDGTSGLAQNAVQPHTISKESRTCADCHMSRKALGLGSGFYDITDNFPDGPPPVEFELEQIVTADGKQLQATNHVGARPLNKEEIEHTRRIGTCIACHAGDRVKIAGNARTDEQSWIQRIPQAVSNHVKGEDHQHDRQPRSKR